MYVAESKLVDVTRPDQVEGQLLSASPDVIINVAAVHAKPDFNQFPGRAYEVNSIGSRNIAELSAKARIPYVFVSTDFVYSGLENKGLITEDKPQDAKLNVYSETKILGEIYALEKGHEPIVWRISSPFGPFDSKAKGPNFLNNVLERLSRGEKVDVVNNIFMSPTYTLDSANLLLDLLSRENSSGIWHGSNSGRTSWFEFARYAAEIASLTYPNAIRAEEPRDTSLSVGKLEKHLGLEVRAWEDAVRSFIYSKELNVS